MNEFLVSYRHNQTNQPVEVHIVNVDDSNRAIAMADNSLLDAEDYYFQSISVLPESSTLSF